MDATIRVFKRVSGLPDNEWDAKAAGAAFCSIRLVVAYGQAINLIGKQGCHYNLQDSAGAYVRVFPGAWFYAIPKGFHDTVWKIVLFSAIWLMRNEIVFNGKRMDIAQLDSTSSLSTQPMVDMGDLLGST